MQNYFPHPANDKMKAKKAIQPGELQVKHHNEICLLVQWLKLYASTEGVTGSIPGQESKIPHDSEQVNLGATAVESVLPNQRVRVPQRKILRAAGKTHEDKERKNKVCISASLNTSSGRGGDKEG